MSNYTNSSNMNLPVPTVGVDPGPDYATNINACMTLIDAHDHTNGKGVKITPSALNINADLSFASNSAKDLKSLIMNVQSSITTANSIFVKLVGSNNELFYYDSSGNAVQITTNGAVNTASSGNITGLSGTAGVNYNAGTFTFSEATNTPANIAIGSVLLGNNTALSKYLTLAPPAAMAANTTITLPTIPAATSIMQMDSSGNITAGLTVDNSSLQNSGSVLSVKSGGITRAMLTALLATSKVTVFTTAGANTYTQSAGVNQVLVMITGGGGGGGSSTTNANAGGGGAGGTAIKLFAASALTSTVTVTIGAAGAGGNSVAGNGVSGSPGGDSTFGAYLTAHGGGGGTRTFDGGARGVGGTAINGDINISGGDGCSGNGADGMGGGSIWGGGGAATWATTGISATVYGSGGGGGSDISTGGNGMSGICVIIEMF